MMINEEVEFARGKTTSIIKGRKGLTKYAIRRVDRAREDRARNEITKHNILGIRDGLLPFFYDVWMPDCILIYTKFVDCNLEIFLKEPRNTKLRIDLCKQVIQGLANLHQLKIAHCNLEPKHILIESIGDKHCALISNLRRAQQQGRFGKVDVSKAWASPELKKSRCVHSEKTDIFSMGLLCYLILSGTTLQNVENDGVINDYRVKMDNLLPELPAAAEMVSNMTRFNPDMRCSATDLINFPLFWEPRHFLRFCLALNSLLNRKEELNNLSFPREYGSKFKWKKKFFSSLKSHMDKKSTYSENIHCLIRFLRNYITHFNEIPKGCRLSDSIDGLHAIIDRRFCGLLVHLYVSCSPYFDSQFRNDFSN